MDLLTKYEHTPVLVAGTLRYTIQQWDDGRLVGGKQGGGGVRARGKQGGLLAQGRPLTAHACCWVGSNVSFNVRLW